MDPLVISLPALLRLPLVKFIAQRRSLTSAAAYAKIWDTAGSPLVLHAELLANEIRRNTNLPVAVGMRYGEPNFESARQQLAAFDEIIVISPYPQFAASTYQSTVSQLKRVFRDQTVYIKKPYFNDVDFITVFKNAIHRHISADVEHVLFSFHGLPEQHLRNADQSKSHCLRHESCCETSHTAHETCYRHQCRYLASKLSEDLDVPSSISFQSRLGPTKWLQPYTIQEVCQLAKRGVRTLAVACPSFISDNVETLYEIGIEVRETFVEAGGKRLELIPSLNESEDWVNLVAVWCQADTSTFQQLNTSSPG